MGPENTDESIIRSFDIINDPDCFFIPGLKADGAPLSFGMHTNTGISGGIGPMGTIRSRFIDIPIPRSRKAQSFHFTGLLIKATFLVLSIIVFYFIPVPENKIVTRLLLSALTLLAGGFFTMVFYRIVKVKSKFFHAKHFRLVDKYRSKGYKRGPHPMFSTTPVGIIAWLLRLLF
ncbi:MAG: hypothetical protein WAW07_13105 [Bacteroidales bacterium]